ncbi:MAG: metallophosphoesterase [Thermoanaerobaculia bacterium]|nr:metallophosphoesterase [Thermoanaerobaculia bacterium]
MTRILCVADLHLGASPGLGRAPYGPESRLADQERAWLAVCELAVNERVELVLFAGDAFHRPRPTPSEILAFRAGLDLLSRYGIEVIAVDGNHDVASPDLPSALSIFDGLILSRTPDVIAWKPEDGPSSAPAELSVATLPWAPPARLVADRGGGDRDDIHRDAAEVLLDVARLLRAQCPPGTPAVLMGHWSVSGASLPAGMLADDLREVVLPLADLEAMGWDAMVFGHLHRPQGLGAGLACYTGSPAVVDWGEAEVPHGVWILDLDGSGAREFRLVEIPDRPFVTLPLSAHEIETDYDLPPEIDGAVVRVRYTATREQAAAISDAALARALYDAGAWRVSVQPTILREERARVGGLDDTISADAALDLWLDTQDIPGGLRAQVRAAAQTYLEEVAA